MACWPKLPVSWRERFSRERNRFVGRGKTQTRCARGADRVRSVSVGLCVCLYSFSAFAGPLTCKNIRDLIDERNGVILWKSYPNISFSDAFPIEKSEFSNLVKSAPVQLWRYLNDLCDECNIQTDLKPWIFIEPIRNLDGLKGGPELYAPINIDNGVSQAGIARKFLDAELSRDVSVLTSVHIRNHDPDLSRNITIISPVVSHFDYPDFGNDLMVGIFEAVTDLKFWKAPELRTELKREFKVGCLTGAHDSCPVLGFGRFLYRRLRKGNFAVHTFDELTDRLCNLYESTAKQ